MQDRWLILLTSPESIEEVRKMPEDKLDFIHAAMDVGYSWSCGRSELELTFLSLKTIEARYTFSPENHDDPFLVSVVQAHLTKHLDFSFDEAHDEVVAALSDKIGDVGNS